MTIRPLLPDRPRRTSAPGAFVRVTRYPDGRTVYAAPAPDPLGEIACAFSRFSAVIGAALVPGFQSMVRYAVEAEKAMARAMSQIDALFDPLLAEANAEPFVTGVVSRWFIRASLDPAYDTPEDLSWAVRRLIAGAPDLEPDVILMTRENRIRVAVAAMRGWEQQGYERLGRVICDRRPHVCAEAEAVGVPWAHCSPMLLWRCEGHTPPEPPLVAHRFWAGTRVEVRCG